MTTTDIGLALLAVAAAGGVVLSAFSYLWSSSRSSLLSKDSGSKDQIKDESEENDSIYPKPPYGIPDKSAREKAGETLPFRSTLVSTLVSSREGFNQPPLIGSKDRSEVKTLWENLCRAVELHGDRPFLGTRSKNPDGSLGNSYEYKTYKEVCFKVLNFGNGLAQLGVSKASKVGIYSINRPEWTITEHATYYNNAIIVPLYDTLGAEAATYILELTEMSICVASSDRIKSLLKFCSTGSHKLKTIIFMDGTVPKEITSYCESIGIKVYSFADVEDLGERNPRSEEDLQLPKPEDIAAITFTSGTTGPPKGAMSTHSAMMSFPTACSLMGDCGHWVQITETDIHCSYLPLAHIFERGAVSCLIYSGGRVAYYSGDVARLLEDVAIIKPTIFVSVPRLLNKIYSKLMHGMTSKGWLLKTLFHFCYSVKKAQIAAGGPLTHWLIDVTLFRLIRRLLGGNVRAIISGAAPISTEVLDFLRICFGCLVLEGYGSSEALCIASSIPGDLKGGALGPPYPTGEVKLVSIPEMGYTANDFPYPRGEICVRGPITFSGYYKDKEKTKEAIDAEGWVHTGDVGQIDDLGRIAIIDRKKNIFKLSQGDYIAPEIIEAVMSRNPLVAQICICGNSLKASIVAVIVPAEDVFPNWAKSIGASAGSFKDLIATETIRSAFQKEIEQFGRANGLSGFEIPKGVFLDHVAWSAENNLVTPTLKVKRHEIVRKYGREIEAMYRNLES